jgi:hypothetical protein
VTAPNDPAAHQTPAQHDKHDQPEKGPDQSRARIIRRAPTGPLPTVASAELKTTKFPQREMPLDATVRADQLPTSLRAPAPRARSAVALSAVSILSGWATSVVSTELIAGWWSTDRLFCVAVGFLALVFAVATIAGVILLLLRRHLGRYLVMTGSVVALLTYLGVFIAGARVSWLVHTLPLLPTACLVLVMLPETRRWVD